MKPFARHGACARYDGSTRVREKTLTAVTQSSRLWRLARHSLVAVPLSAVACRAMQLDPVSRRTPLSLDDRVGRSPSGAPRRRRAEGADQAACSTSWASCRRRSTPTLATRVLVVLQGRDAVRQGRHDPEGLRRVSTRWAAPYLVQGADARSSCATTISGASTRRSRPRGMVGIFNRSHYEDVLVVRVKNIVPKPVWSKRYDQINEFERMLDDNGVEGPQVLPAHLARRADEAAARPPRRSDEELEVSRGRSR